MAPRSEPEGDSELRARILLEWQFCCSLERISLGVIPRSDYRTVDGTKSVEAKRITSEAYNELTGVPSRTDRSHDSSILSGRWTVMIDQPTLSDIIEPMPTFPPDDPQASAEAEALGFRLIPRHALIVAAYLRWISQQFFLLPVATAPLTLGPSSDRVGYRETSRNPENSDSMPSLPCCITLLEQVAKRGAVSWSTKPDPVAPQAHDQPNGEPGHHVKPFCEPRSHCERTPSPAVDDRDEPARQAMRLMRNAV